MGPALKPERCALGFSEVHACVSPGKAALSLRKAELGVWACVPPPQALAVGFLFWWRCFFISGGSLWFFKSRPSVQSLDVTSEQTVFSYLYQL